jgi:hypothetical protein
VPPDAFLAGTRGEVALDKGGSCWRRPNPDVPGGSIGICVTTEPRVPDALLVVTSGETLSMRFSAMTPTEVFLQREDVSTALTPGNPVRFVVNLPVGVHTVNFFTRFLPGDITYRARLDVRAPTSGGNLTLTG